MDFENFDAPPEDFVFNKKFHADNSEYLTELDYQLGWWRLGSELEEIAKLGDDLKTSESLGDSDFDSSSPITFPELEPITIEEDEEEDPGTPVKIIETPKSPKPEPKNDLPVFIDVTPNYEKRPESFPRWGPSSGRSKKDPVGTYKTAPIVISEESSDSDSSDDWGPPQKKRRNVLHM